MTLGQLKELVDHISETWRRGEPKEQRLDLADLDGALGELDELETDTAAESEAVDHLRGRIEILMDEIDIALGIEPEPIDLPDELQHLESAQPAPEEGDTRW